ncbi:MAG: germination protein YpeB [Bacillota bacterium]|jgi:spore germination protein|nr:germination protein YpeB [Bacillota bacterium]HHT90041.1 hypothetical protein [Bacillota bacterium]
MPKSVKGKLIAIVFVVGLLGVGYAAGQYYLHGIYQRQVEVGYRRALGELCSHLDEITKEMGRARLAVSPKQRSLISANLRRLVYAAQSNMGELPLGEIHLERISHLLDRIDAESHAYWQDGDNSPLLDQLHEQIGYVSREFGQLVERKDQEFPWVFWYEYFSTAAVVPQFLQALTLINDGLEEFDAPVRQGTILGEDIDGEQAIEAARVFSERENLNFQVISETKGSIPSYTVVAIDGEERVIVEVSQKGGMVLWMTVASAVQDNRAGTLTLEEIIKQGWGFLEERGFTSLHITDAQTLQNRVTLTFVPMREGVLHYGEPLRVQVSAVDGSIIGFWATSFFLAQSRVRPERTVGEAAWSVNEKIQAGVEILDQKMALILNEQQKETLTTRLGVQYQGDYYLIYLNFETGDEEHIVQVASPQFF